jgi:Zn-dependent metalloprotease
MMAALALGLACSGAAIAVNGSSAATTAPKAISPSGSFALSGADAAAYQLPADVKAVHSVELPDGRTQTRYQQYVDGAAVAGAQVSVIRSASGVAQTVIGAHVDGLSATNDKVLTGAKARSVVSKKIGDRGHWSTEYQIDPRTGRAFFAVESIRSDQRPTRWVDAQSGKIVKAFDALAHGTGTGVKGDTKSVDSTPNAATGLYELRSADGRKLTYDNQNRLATPILMTDADDNWNLAGTTSPGQAAGVDAHYYADVVDDYYLATYGRNSIDGNGQVVIKSRVHYSTRLCNASWNGEWMSYGDGDDRTCLSLAGSLDVVGHELTHGVTDYSSELIYENQSGALNEAFSDMMGNSIEFYADAGGRDPGVEPDWLIGEDTVFTRGDPTPGFRNMADPAQDGDPDHMVDLYTGTGDSGGVHINSGIPNHVYYLAVNGGQNAGCTAGQWRTGPTHTEDCDVSVPAIGLAESEQIFYDAFTSLNAWANFCDARNATVATATARSAASGDAVTKAWDAVGVHAGCTGGVQPPPPCVGDSDAELPFGTPDGYGNDGDCTWTYDNGTAGFAFHFSLLDVEKDFDYVHVKDAAGNTLATYTGLYRRGVTSPCIPTPTGSVQLVSDPGVVDRGFIVDAVVPC